MKFLKLILVAGLLAVGFTASAQFDYFAAPRTIQLPAQLITATSSNQVIDIHGFQGTAKIDLFAFTNSGNSALTFLPLSSPDRTNWTIVPYALATLYTNIVTNNNYGTALPIATNYYNYAGVKTTPTAATAGFATPYIAQAAFTNIAATTLTTNVVTIGFQVPDAGRYLQLLWTVTGGSNPTNTVGAAFTGRKTEE